MGPPERVGLLFWWGQDVITQKLNNMGNRVACRRYPLLGVVAAYLR